MEMYNIAIMELRNAWRITHPRDVFLHMKPLLQTLTREPDTMRTRRRKREDTYCLWDMVSDEQNQFVLYDIQDDEKVKTHTVDDLADSPYMFYNEAHIAEDKVLFPDDAEKQNMPFREIQNGVKRITSGVLPSDARHLVKGMEAIDLGLNPFEAIEDDQTEQEDRMWGVAKVWETGLAQLRKEKISKERRELLMRVGLFTDKKKKTYEQRMYETDPIITMERDRSVGFKESFHEGDLEPGAKEKYDQVQERIHAMLGKSHNGPVDWVWFIMEIMDWFGVKADSDDHSRDPHAPWPHSFIVQDVVLAFAAMAMFFPELEMTRLVTLFLGTSESESFRNSGLFDPKGRSKTRPDRRTRTSYKFRDSKFWDEWREFLKKDRYYADIYPLDWAVVIRPIIAKLYRAGVIPPAYLQNHPEIVAGMATCNSEPHRPGKMDLFITYEDRFGKFGQQIPPNYLYPDKWPQLLPLAILFGQQNPGARFALLRLWSAPHFYPYMVGMDNRKGCSFLDSAGRSWEWSFVPKDMPCSEFSAHYTVGNRLDLLRRQLGDRVMHRGDLILVMGTDSRDLLKHATGVTFALQTKPWLREIDLWKSFVNVDLEFLQGLDSHWLD